MLLAAALLPVLLPVSLGAVVQEEVRVVGPGKPNAATPATLVVEPAAMLIVACDADDDGRTTRTELDRCVQRSFPGDVDAKIGYIAYGTWQQTWLGDQGALPSPLEVDRDGDDRISLDELQVQFARLFGRYDKNGDGAVTRAEALTIRATAAGDRNGPRPRRPERVPGGRPEAP